MKFNQCPTCGELSIFKLKNDRDDANQKERRYYCKNCSQIFSNHTYSQVKEKSDSEWQKLKHPSQNQKPDVKSGNAVEETEIQADGNKKNSQQEKVTKSVFYPKDNSVKSPVQTLVNLSEKGLYPEGFIEDTIVYGQYDVKEFIRQEDNLSIQTPAGKEPDFYRGVLFAKEYMKLMRHELAGEKLI